MTMFRSSALVLLVALLAPAAARADIAVGLAAPLSGALQPLGQQVRNGVEAAVADINSSGGVLHQKLTLTVLDDACDPKQAVLVAGQLVEDHVAMVAGHLCSGASIAAAGVYAAARIVQISPGTTAAAYTDERAGPGTFRLSARDDRQGAVAGAYLAQTFAGKHVAFLDDKSTYGAALVDAARMAFNAAGGKETLAQSFDGNAKASAALASVLQAANVDALFIGSAAADAAAIARALKDSGSAITIVGGDALASEDFFKAAGDASDGVLVTALPDPRFDPDNAALVAVLRQRQIEPAGYTFYAYAAVEVWAQAVAAAGTTDFDKVSAAIAGGSFKTPLGTASFDAKGDASLPGYTLYVWKSGNYRPLAR
jgi:branched-chain amino acid transport system substrate-binding protein